MDAQLKAKWTGALRSAEYPQARGALKKDAGFCCLGVLCDVMGGKWVKNTLEPDVQDARINGELQSYYLAPRAMELAGLTDSAQETLWGMNDEGKPFPEIADYIEANL